MAGQADGQIFVSNLAGPGGNSFSPIGVYDATTGATINASLVTGYRLKYITVSGGNVFVSNEYFDYGTIGKYDANTGATVNASLVSGLNYPGGMVVFGGNLIVMNSPFANFTGAAVDQNAIGSDRRLSSCIRRMRIRHPTYDDVDCSGRRRSSRKNAARSVRPFRPDLR